MTKESFIEQIGWMLDDFYKENCTANDTIVGIRRKLEDYDNSNKTNDIHIVIKSDCNSCGGNKIKLENGFEKCEKCEKLFA